MPDDNAVQNENNEYMIENTEWLLLKKNSCSKQYSDSGVI